MSDSPREIVLQLIQQSVNGLTSADIAKNALALDRKQISNALYHLKNDGQVESVDQGAGKPSVYYAPVSPITAPTIKKGEITGVEYCSGCKQLPHHCKCSAAPTIDDHPALKAIVQLEGQLERQNIHNLPVKQQVLGRLAAILHPDIAAVLDEIAVDIS